MEQARPQGPLEPLKPNLWQSNVPEEPPKCQGALLSCNSFCRDPCTNKHISHTLAWGARLRGGSWQGHGKQRLLENSCSTAEPGLAQAPVSLGWWWHKAVRLVQKDTSPQGLHLCNTSILTITARLCMRCISTQHHITEHQLEIALVIHCVLDILSQEDWHFTGGYFYGQR